MTRKHSLSSITVRKTLLETLARRGITGPGVEAIRRGIPRDRLSRGHGGLHVIGKRRTKTNPIRRYRVGGRTPRTQHGSGPGASLQALARSKTRKQKHLKPFTPKQRSLLAQKILNKQTKKIKASVKKYTQYIRKQKDMTPQTKKKRIAVAQKDARNAIQHYKSKLSQIQRAGRTMLGKIRATAALTPQRKRELQIQVSHEMKRRMEQSTELFA